MTDLDGAIHELADWLRIPSVSTAGGNPPALREAAEWALRKILEAGGTAELVSGDTQPTSSAGTGHPPLVVGELRAAREDAPALEALLRGELPEGAELELRLHGAEPSRFDPADPALQAALRALERATGVAPAVVRSGGSIPILSAFAARGIPAIVGGFGLPDDRIHAPDESCRVASLELGLKTARALYEELAACPEPTVARESPA